MGGSVAGQHPELSGITIEGNFIQKFPAMAFISSDIIML